jgi:hypothetical protein
MATHFGFTMENDIVAMDLLFRETSVTDISMLNGGLMGILSILMNLYMKLI